MKSVLESYCLFYLVMLFFAGAMGCSWSLFLVLLFDTFMEVSVGFWVAYLKIDIRIKSN